VAVDIQGPGKPRPYHERAGAQFTTVVDQANSLSRLFGYRAIPNGILVDEQGRLAHRRLGGFDIRKPETTALVQQFATTGAVPADGAAQLRPSEHDHFERGYALYLAGDLDSAARIWREGIAVEPDNWNMRKQLWAIENPGKFYDGDVDYAWQKEQVQQGR
jgi:hypothetical protein